MGFSKGKITTPFFLKRDWKDFLVVALGFNAGLGGAASAETSEYASLSNLGQF